MSETSYKLKTPMKSINDLDDVKSSARSKISSAKKGYKKHVPPRVNPARVTRSQMPVEDSIYQEVEESQVLSDSQAHLEKLSSGDLPRFDHTTPGPDHSLWQARVKLFKTLLLDCRPPRERKLREETSGEEDTDPTRGK